MENHAEQVRGVTIEKVSLVKVAGVCAILAVVSHLAGAIVYFAGIGQVDPDGVTQILIAMNDNRAAFLTFIWLGLFGAALLIPAALGLFQALRVAGTVLWIALVAMFTGALLWLGAAIINLSIVYELAPGYVEASDATKPALAVIASTLDRIHDVANDVGSVLLRGIGVLLFTLAILRTSIIPKWVGWLGLPSVVLVWLSTLDPVLETLSVLDDIAFVLFMVWLVAMGVVLLRLREPATGTSTA